MPTALTPAPIASAPWLSAMQTHDVAVHAHAQQQWRLHYDQLSAGAFQGLIEQIALPGAVLIRESTNQSVYQYGEMDAGSYGFALASRQQSQTSFHGYQVTAHTLMVGSTRELNLCAGEQFQITGLVLQADVLQAIWQAIAPDETMPYAKHAGTVALQAPLAQQLNEQFAQVFDWAYAQGLSRAADTVSYDLQPSLQQARDAVLYQCLKVLQHANPSCASVADTRSASERQRVVNMARDAMHATQYKPLSLLDICRISSASPRKLNYCFQAMLGVSPMQYFKALRLNEVRRLLQHPSKTVHTVQDAAASWGFWHLGQFSADYKHLFGELPSNTLQAALVK